MSEQVRVVEVIQETADAHSLVLELPPAWSYQPGQFLTVRAGDCARSYSFSSSPFVDEPTRITVKRIADGRGSNWICDNITAGSTLECMPPGGVFTPASFDRDFLLLAGGSGITPIMSILKSALIKGDGRIVLGYANRDPSSIIFAAELDELVAVHGDRLTVRHWIDSTHGPPTAAGLRELIADCAGHEAFVCGPEPFMELVRSILGDGVHIEEFTSMDDNPFERARSDRTALVQVTIDGQTLRIPWPVKTKLLDLLLDQGLNPPFSCRQGTCGACATRMLQGDVELINNEILEEEDFADGYILACQALPVTDEIHIDYT